MPSTDLTSPTRPTAREGDPFDVAIVGAGLAGMAAAVFAGDRGLKAVQIGNAGALLFSSGLLDLLGVHPTEEGRTWRDPFAALAAVAHDLPGHPYARVSAAEVRAAFAGVVRALAAGGVAYREPGPDNCDVVTGVGTVKTTYCVPETMLPGVAALAAREPGVLVDFPGLREYSARAVAAALGARWPGLRIVHVDFAARAVTGEVHAVHLARLLELADHRAALAERVRPHLGDARVVGFPAVLGIRRPIAADLGRALGVPVFEIPTLPTSVPGMRLKEALERAVAARRVRRLVQSRAVAVVPEGDGFALHVDNDPRGGGPLRARSVVLATGRFMGRGLIADRTRVRESLMDLRVVQPASRADWHRADVFDPRGHPLSFAGVDVDQRFRPRDENGQAVHPRLFAIGTLLAHHDWVRMKCGAGIAFASAYAAIATAADDLGAGREPAAAGPRGAA